MPVTAALLRSYGAINADESDAAVQMYIDAAKEEARLAEVPEMANNPVYDMLILAIALDLHDNRGVMGGEGTQLSPRILSMMHQVRGAANREAGT